MDNEEFLRRLNELAELQVIKVASPAKRKPEDEVIVWRNGQAIEIDDTDNPTLYYKIKKLKSDVRKCDDCSKKVKNRTVTKKLYAYPVKHWRKLCNNCNMFEHPDSGKYCLVGASTQNVYIQYLKRTHPELQEINELQDEIQAELTPMEKKLTK